MAVQQHAPAQALERKLRERTARVGVLGLGYAGLPMAVEIAQAGFDVTGLDINPGSRQRRQRRHQPGLRRRRRHDPRAARGQKLLCASTSLDLLADLDVVLIAVPTPLKDDRQPDLRYVQAATRTSPRGSIQACSSSSRAPAPQEPPAR